MEDAKILNLLMEISGDIKVIKRDLGEDYKLLHGNGKAGLVERVTELETQMREKKSFWESTREWLGWLFAILNLGVALYLHK